MRRRPWPIVILAALQIFFEPAFNLLLSSWLSHLTIQAYLGYFVHTHDWLSLFYLFGLPPLMGLSIYAMKKWSYALFFACSTWMLIENLAVFQASSVSPSFGILMYAGNLLFVAYFLLPQVHRPYLDPKLRWWESKTRFLVNWACRIGTNPESSDDFSESASQGLSCRIQDFSEGGVFAVLDEPFEMKDTLQLRFCPPDGEILAIEARPVFSRKLDSGVGFGLQFIFQDKQARKRVSKLARSLKNSRTPCRHGNDSSWMAFKTWAKRLLTTGKGLLPEPDAAARPAPALSTSSGNCPESTEQGKSRAS